MSAVQHYHVAYHWEIGGKMVGQSQHMHVVASGSDYASLKTAVVTNGGKSYPNATFVVEQAKNEGPIATQ